MANGPAPPATSGAAPAWLQPLVQVITTLGVPTVLAAVLLYFVLFRLDGMLQKIEVGETQRTALVQALKDDWVDSIGHQTKAFELALNQQTTAFQGALQQQSGEFDKTMKDRAVVITAALEQQTAAFRDALQQQTVAFRDAIERLRVSRVQTPP